jgi:ABC-type Fe3+/spermidine/putrescine transport system ATPase subunit
MVFQNYALWPHMTVRENLAFGLEMQHLTMKERQQRVDAMLSMIQMREYGDRPPAQLSGGQQQRVALGRALILQPEVVLLDEPLSNLDAKLRLEMREHIKRLHQQLGLTMIYVTHDQNEALSMADRIAIMHQGKIFQLGTPREIYNRPANRFIADFVGETNLLRGKVTEIGAQVMVTTADGRLWSTTPFSGIQIGAEVDCSIRPERLTLRTNARNFVNQWEGEVLRVVYLGDHEQYFLRLRNGDELKVIEYNMEFSLAEPGKIVTVGCDANDVVLLRKEA